MPRPLLWSLALLPLGVFIAVAGYVLHERAVAGRGLPAFSVYSDDSDGLAEAARFLEALGWQPVAVKRPIEQTRDRGLLVLTEPARSGPLADAGGISEDDARGILNWVEAGNTLLLCSRHETGLHTALQLFVNSDGQEGGGPPVTVDGEEAGGYTSGVDRLSVRDGTTLSDRNGLALWRVHDRPGALLLRRGAGRVLVVADPGILTRRGLLREDNAVFLANVASMAGRDGAVYFDEYHHGFRSAGGVWGYLGYHGQQLLFVPLLLAAGAAVWAAGIRLGPAVASPPSASADAVDYAAALALLYRRAGVRLLPARTLARGFLDALRRHLRLRRNALPADILASWRRQVSATSADRLQPLLRGVGALHKGDVSGRQLLSWSRAFDEFREQWLVERGKEERVSG
jgi:uncharacterized protein DUF4350